MNGALKKNEMKKFLRIKVIIFINEKINKKIVFHTQFVIIKYHLVDNCFSKKLSANTQFRYMF